MANSNDFFNILSFDGASITGGMGWMSIGALRDRLHRHLRLTELGLEHFRDCWPRFKKELQLEPLMPIAPDIPTEETAGVVEAGVISIRRRSPQPQIKPRTPLAAIPFLKKLSKMANESGHSREHDLLAVWLRFQQQHQSIRYNKEWYVSPYITELALMLTAVDLYRASSKVQEDLVANIRALKSKTRNRWRYQAAAKNHPTLLPFVEEQIDQGLESILKLFMNQPSQFLIWRWVQKAAPTEFFGPRMIAARQFLHTNLKGGGMENYVMGDMEQIDLLAGTSSGGLNALVLGQHDCLSEGIEQAMEMWTKLTGSNVNTNSDSKITPRLVNALLGNTSFLGADSQEVYEEYFGHGKTLESLKRHVAITTVQLDSGEVDAVPILRRWKPVIYHNLPPEITGYMTEAPTPGPSIALPSNSQTDQHFAGIRQLPSMHWFDNSSPLVTEFAQYTQSVNEVKLLDIARYTSGLPIAANVFSGPNLVEKPKANYAGLEFNHPDTSGFIDGGFYANNPSLAATITSVSRGIDPARIAVMSIGNGRQGLGYAEIEHGDLGYNSWLLKHGHVGLLFDIMLDVGIDAINAYCSTILGTARFRGGSGSGRFLRDDVWTDCPFMLQTLLNHRRDTVEFKLDEALAIQRYIYQHPLPKLPDDFFLRYWKPLPPNPPPPSAAKKKTAKKAAKKRKQAPKSRVKRTRVTSKKRAKKTPRS